MYLWLYRQALGALLLTALLQPQPPGDPAPTGPQIVAERRVFLPVVAAQRPPQVTASDYVTGVTGLNTFRKLGCAAAYDTQQRPLADGVVILFFGQPAYTPPFGAEPGGYGTHLPGAGRFVSIPQIRAAVQAWIDGYLDGFDDGVFSCAAPSRGLPRITLVVATSNEPLVINQPLAAGAEQPDAGDPDPTMPEHGIGWGRLINNLGDYIVQKNGTRFLSIAGGSDIELAWNGPTNTRTWVESYYTLADYPLYVPGSCDGCPDNPKNAPSSGDYSFGWTAQDIWTVVTFKNTVVIPQIYLEDGTQARQWATLATVTRSLGPIRFRGALAQFQACVDRQNDDPCTGVKNTPQQGWSQFAQALKNQALDSRLPWLTDVRWNFDQTPFQKGGS
ncbi:MAG: hypothetical protein OHK0022_33740 [Roseiflexaceae bacterium]